MRPNTGLGHPRHRRLTMLDMPYGRYIRPPQMPTQAPCRLNRPARTAGDRYLSMWQ